MNTNIRLAVALGVVLLALLTAFILIPAPAEAPALPFESEHVRVGSPLPGASVGKSFTVQGEARGPWYFEASFPVEVRDPSGEQVGLGIAQAEGEWMTEEFVPFTAQVSVPDYTGPATLVLKKDNPSGLPENDDSVEFEIVVQ